MNNMECCNYSKISVAFATEVWLYSKYKIGLKERGRDTLQHLGMRDLTLKRGGAEEMQS
jgi:hypothetical protein